MLWFVFFLFCYFVFFFFSSRRRHTRWSGDWSSDVCSSDLNLKLHHMDYNPYMSLWDNFRQNRRPKVFSEKIEIFTRRVPVENVKTLKTWLWVFSPTDNPRNLKLHHIDHNPNMSLWDNFRQNRRPKVFNEKIAIFPRRGPGKNCKTLKTWLWVFSAADNLRNLKLHHIEYDPNKIGRASCRERV